MRFRPTSSRSVSCQGTASLCTDGVSNVIQDEEIAAVIDHLTPTAAVRRLLALTRARRTPDNASAMVISVAAAEAARALPSD